MFRKKAQAAMEFLMTYGWAILVVLVAIGALAYFGVLDPAKFLPERCTGTPGLDCIDTAVVKDENVTFALKNNIGYGINVSVLSGPVGSAIVPVLTDSINDECATPELSISTDLGVTYNGDDTTDPYSVLIANNVQFNVRVTCPGTLVGPRLKGDITFNYVNSETSLTHKSTTSITSKGSG